MAVPLHFDGFYYAGPKPWVDWHAGVRMHGVHFCYRRYYANRDWLGCFRDVEFDFWSFSESITSEIVADAKQDCAPRDPNGGPLCMAGSYSIEGDTLSEVLAPSWTGGMAWVVRYQILDDRLLVLKPDIPNNALLFRPKPIP